MSERVIWRYDLAVDDRQTVQMPKDAEILSVQMQGRHNDSGTSLKYELMMWALVDPNTKAIEDRVFRVLATGEVHEPSSPGPSDQIQLVCKTHIATVQNDGEVWHVFEVPEGWE